MVRAISKKFETPYSRYMSTVFMKDRKITNVTNVTKLLTNNGCSKITQTVFINKLKITNVNFVTKLIGELYENFVRKRTLVIYQSQSEVIKVMLQLHQCTTKPSLGSGSALIPSANLRFCGYIFQIKKMYRYLFFSFKITF